MAVGRSDAMGFSRDYIAAMVGDETADAVCPVAPDGSRSGLGFAETWRMMVEHIHALGDESHGIAPRVQLPGSFELMCDTMLGGGTLRGGIGRLCRFSQIVGSFVQVSSRSANGRLFVTGKSSCAPSLACEVQLDSFALVLHCAAMWAMGSQFRASSVRCSGAMAGIGSALGLVGTITRSDGEGFTLVYEAEVADRAFAAKSSEGWSAGTYHAYLELVAMVVGEGGVAAEDALIERMRTKLSASRQGQRSIARDMGMSVATLRRRLAERGECFRTMSAVARKEAAIMLLASGRPIDAIAGDMGLSDARSFRRACVGWFGQPPSEVRRTLGRRAAGVGSDYDD